jgi:hypothetical protein
LPVLILKSTREAGREGGGEKETIGYHVLKAVVDWLQAIYHARNPDLAASSGRYDFCLSIRSTNTSVITLPISHATEYPPKRLTILENKNGTQNAPNNETPLT